MAKGADAGPSASHKRKRADAPAASASGGERTGGEAGARGGHAKRGRGQARGRGGGRGRGGASRGGHAGSRKAAARAADEEDADAADAPLGVSKLKASLRQTRRLLAKDNVAPPVRQEAERRARALETEIADRERSNIERENARKSHATRFFERQKLVRQIKKLVKAEEKTTQGQELLQEARIRLAYVLNWPHEHPYVSLFPTVGSGPFADAKEPGTPPADASESVRRAFEVRALIVSRMADGSLSSKPEEQLAAESGAARARDALRSGGKQASGSADEDSDADSSGEESQDGLAHDDFFAGESESEGDE